MKTNSCVGIVIQAGKVLLCERHSYDSTYTGWCLPGGKVERHENVTDALVREIKEEVGLDVTDITYIATEENDKFNIYFFKVEVEGEVKLNTKELKSYGYFSIDDLPVTLLPLTKKVLLKNKDLFKEI